MCTQVENPRVCRCIDYYVSFRECRQRRRGRCRCLLAGQSVFPSHGLDLRINKFEAITDRIDFVLADVYPVAVVSYKIAWMQNIVIQ